jgi:phospholipid/cholesterol/gamma-HCH transport system substrate-binding protein
MNQKLHEDQPWRFYSIIFLSGLFIFALWFFLHPNSPWHSRNYYKVAFEEIGSLKIGNQVNVNGLAGGYVKNFELTDSCVWAEIAILSKIKIPDNSKVQIANVGLMGERVVEISLGNSKNYYADNARIIGSFDMGSTTIGKLVADVLDEANNIVDILSNAADSLFSEEKIKDYKRLERKATQFGNKTSRFVNSAEHSALASFDSLVIAKNKIVAIIDEIKPALDGMVNSTESIEKNFANLEKSLEEFKKSLISIEQKLESDGNTISLALNEKHDGNLRRQMKKISEDAENLMEKIKQRGLDLNVDIF